MMGLVLILATCAGQTGMPAPSPGVEPAPVTRVVDAVAEDVPTMPMSAMPAAVPPSSPAPPPFSMTGEAPVNYYQMAQERTLFQSDHAFDGFVGPMTDPIQSKDARSLTEARFLFINNWARPGTPVIGSGTFQVYALQLRLAVTERLQLFADKDGIVRFSPSSSKSVTGLANIAAGAKYVFIRDVENQFLFSGAVQFEPSTGYANIFQNHGSGLLGVYGIFAKEFADSWHISGQFGENTAMQNQQSGYFYTHLHLDKRFGKFVPFFEANWFYYNQSAKFLPASVGLEGAGLLNLGTTGFTGNSIVTLAPGFKYDFNQHLELGCCYQFPVSDFHKSLIGNQLLVEMIFRF